jgi:hypothetical protein
MCKWTNQLNRHLSNGEVQIVNKYMKEHTTFLANREMQNKTTLRFHSTPVWMVIIKNRKDKGWQE